MAWEGCHWIAFDRVLGKITPVLSALGRALCARRPLLDFVPAGGVGLSLVITVVLVVVAVVVIVFLSLWPLGSYREISCIMLGVFGCGLV